MSVLITVIKFELRAITAYFYSTSINFYFRLNNFMCIHCGERLDKITKKL